MLGFWGASRATCNKTGDLINELAYGIYVIQNDFSSYIIPKCYGDHKLSLKVFQIESQNISSWNGPIRIQSSSLFLARLPKNKLYDDEHHPDNP